MSYQNGEADTSEGHPILKVKLVKASLSEKRSSDEKQIKEKIKGIASKQNSTKEVKKKNQVSIKSKTAHLKSEIKFNYPYRSRKLGHQGQVEVQLWLSKSGTVKNVKLTKSSGYNELDQEVIKSMKQAKFSPATKNGKAIESSFTQKVNFRIN